MGIALWIAAGLAAGLATVWIARIAPFLRVVQWLSDLALAVVAAVLAGFAATALDFGGWNEADWRAIAFAFAAALAVTGWLRVARLLARRRRDARAAR